MVTEGALIYFLLIQLCFVDYMYQYSLESFNIIFLKVIDKTSAFDTDKKRVLELREQIRTTIYQWVSKGLFEKHKKFSFVRLHSD